MTKPTEKNAQLEAAKLAAKLKEQQGVFRASVEASSDGVINPNHHADSTANTDDNGQSNTQSNGQEHGVSAPILRDEKTGQWLPGGRGGPGRGGGKRPKAILAAIENTVQPELVADVMLGLLTHPNSWRANAEGAKLYFHYLVGPAPQRTVEQENVLDAILVKLRSVQGDKIDTDK
jgi:hypothetical protein